jgi:inosine-uridine nucleoside N-ribohydrolase
VPDYPTLTEADRVARLEPPTSPVEMVLDTDTYNEVDDQFALVHALGGDPDLRAVYAAPFDNDRSSGPADGMAKSHEEILRILERCGRPDSLAYRGAERYLDGPADAVESPAVDDLVARARADRDGPLYVVAIGAPTNVASALRRAPDLVEEVVVVWLGGNPHEWPSAREFNLMQDLEATRTLFESGVPLVQVPCLNVAEHVDASVPEIEALLGDRGPVADLLRDRFTAHAGDRTVYSKEIWDLAATAVVAGPDLTATSLTHSPILTDELTWSHDPHRHLIRVVRRVDRDAILRDLLAALDAATP